MSIRNFGILTGVGQTLKISPGLADKFASGFGRPTSNLLGGIQ